MKLWASVVGALVLVCLCGSADAAESPSRPIDVAIGDITANPASFHGKLVRVRGTIDECVNYNCKLCTAGHSAERNEEKRVPASIFRDGGQ